MPKRAPNEGTIRKRTLKRPGGSSYVRYAAMLTLGYDAAGGQIRREGPSRKTQREASADLADLKRQQRAGLLHEGASSTLGAYLSYWLHQREGELRERSIRAYHDDITRFLVPLLGDSRLDRLKPTDIQTMQTTLLAEHSPYVVRRVRACLSAALTQAVRWQLVAANPVDATTPVRLPETHHTIWQPHEVRRFLEVAREHPLYALYCLSIATGLRLGEVRGLQWGDLEGNVVHVQRQVIGDQATPRFAPPKTRAGRRRVPLPRDVLYELAQHRQWQERQRDVAGEMWRCNAPNGVPFDLVFATGIGTALGAGKITGPLKRLASSAGLPTIRFHDLRHGAASLWIYKGVDVATVAARLGHSDINTTLRTYAHHFDAQLERPTMTLEELLE